VVPGAPWQIPAEAVELPTVRQAAMEIKNRRRQKQPQRPDEATLDLAGSSSDTEERVPAP
jgi:hypothetical protein